MKTFIFKFVCSYQRNGDGEIAADVPIDIDAIDSRVGKRYSGDWIGGTEPTFVRQA